MSVLKKEFIDRMAERGGITKKAARQGVELFIGTLLDCMAEDEKVMINGFGRFEMIMVKEKKIPFREDGYIAPAHRKMKFYPSRLLGGVIEEMRRKE